MSSNSSIYLKLVISSTTGPAPSTLAGEEHQQLPLPEAGDAQHQLVQLPSPEAGDEHQQLPLPLAGDKQQQLSLPEAGDEQQQLVQLHGAMLSCVFSPGGFQLQGPQLGHHCLLADVRPSELCILCTCSTFYSCTA